MGGRPGFCDLPRNRSRGLHRMTDGVGPQDDRGFPGGHRMTGVYSGTLILCFGGLLLLR